MVVAVGEVASSSNCYMSLYSGRNKMLHMKRRHKIVTILKYFYIVYVGRIRRDSKSVITISGFSPYLGVFAPFYQFSEGTLVCWCIV